VKENGQTVVKRWESKQGRKEKNKKEKL